MRNNYQLHDRCNDATSILNLLETRWGLAPPGSQGANAYDLTDALGTGAGR